MLDELRKALLFEIELGGPFVVIPEIAAPEVVLETVSIAQGVQLSEPAKENKTAAEIDEPWSRLSALIPEESPLHEIDTLDALSDYVANTVLTPLDETRTNPVFGVGNPASDLMVIGEAPGADEDAQGEPFVGRAGQLLDKILDAIDFGRDRNVYIANILKSRPPNNRNPLPHEIAAHEPVLYRQMQLIKPKLILCVGRVSGTTLLKRDDSLKNLRQRFHDFHGIPLVVTYHPAALLRNPNWKRPTWDDVKMLRARYEEMMAGAKV